jgi:3-hydroxymyristoyl/3-hydroxydecanoyl-(acyl carrier protein) dehydratase
MIHSNSPFPSSRWLAMLVESSQRSSSLHRQMLEVRQNGLQGVEALIAAQLQAAAGRPAPGVGVMQPASAGRPAVFTSEQLDAFGTGRISDCLGPSFKGYDNRRIPRIPNGDLKMMTRVVSITGKPKQQTRSEEIVVEYDVDPDAWFFQDAGSQEIPTGLVMEIALQPCGFLSAYLDSYSLVPYGEFYFRNLDGQIQFLSAPTLGGKTVTTHARMVTSVVSSGTIIQKFAFRLSCQGQLFAEGESTFGYFSAQTMANQVGLDSGQAASPVRYEAHPAAEWENRSDLQRSSAHQAGLRLPTGRLNMLGSIMVDPTGGRYGKGSVYSRRAVDPQDWFYPFHFYQDPVMPGSLGVEAVLQALQVYALKTRQGSALRSARFCTPLASRPMTWRYRGQITQQHNLVELEVHVSDIARSVDQVTIKGDASLWVDNLRIYEVRDAAVCIAE